MKLIKVFWVIIFLVLSISNYCQTYSLTTSDSAIIDFVKKNFRKGNFHCKVFIWDSCDLFRNSGGCYLRSYVAKENDSILSESTIHEFQNQFNAIKKDCPKDFVFLKNRAHKKEFHYVSIPLFSTDKNIAIIKYGVWCGNECGHGGIYIYKKINGEWKLVDVRSKWIS